MSQYLVNKIAEQYFERSANLYEGVLINTNDFYSVMQAFVIEQKLGEGISMGVVTFSDPENLPEEKEYFRIAKGNDVIDICCSPYGMNATYISFSHGTFYSIGCLIVLVKLTPFIGTIYDFLTRKDNVPLDPLFKESIRFALHNTFETFTNNTSIPSYHGAKPEMSWGKSPPPIPKKEPKINLPPINLSHPKPKPRTPTPPPDINQPPPS